MIKESDYVGKKFGKLTVLGRGKPYVSPKGKSQPTLLCVCECGNEKEMRPYDLRQGNVISCGCGSSIRRNADELPQINRLYGVWNSIKNRCRNINNENYHCYGGRGITMCDEWLKDFQPFYDWALSHGYKEGLQIDRINVNGNYEPSNCRWVTPKENCRNTRKNRHITINGETKLLTDWAQEAGINKGTLSLRISRGWPQSDWLLPNKYTTKAVCI